MYSGLLMQDSIIKWMETLHGVSERAISGWWAETDTVMLMEFEFSHTDGGSVTLLSDPFVHFSTAIFYFSGLWKLSRIYAA